MSTLIMLSCDGCGAQADGHDETPWDWLAIEGPATKGEMDVMNGYRHASGCPTRHACSPECLVVLAERLAALDDALKPVDTD